MKKVYQIISQSCLFSTVITLIFCLFAIWSNTLTKPAMELSQYLLILLFSFLCAVANLLFLLKRIPKIILIILHYVLLTASFFSVFYAKISVRSGSQIAVIYALFTALYALSALLYFLFRKLFNRFLKKSDKVVSTHDSDYKPLY